MRLKAVEYTTPLLAVAAKGSRPGVFWRVQNALPADSEFVHCYMGPGNRSVVFVFHHDSFPDVPEGAEIPREPLLYESRIVEDAHAPA